MFVIVCIVVWCITFVVVLLHQLAINLFPAKQTNVISVDFDPYEEDKQAELDDSIAFYEMRIEQLKTLSRMYENELETTTDAKKRRTLLSKCLSLDQQTYTAQQKLNKLRRDV